MAGEEDDEVRETAIPVPRVEASGEEAQEFPNDIRQFVQAVRERVGEVAWAENEELRAFAEHHANQSETSAMRSTVQYVLNAAIDLDLPAELHAEVIRECLLLYSWVIRREMLDSIWKDLTENGHTWNQDYQDACLEMVHSNLKGHGENIVKYMEAMTSIPAPAREKHGGLN